MNTTPALTDLDAAEAALQRLQDASLALDLATARVSHRLARCRRLAGDARANLILIKL